MFSQFPGCPKTALPLHYELRNTNIPSRTNLPPQIQGGAGGLSVGWVDLDLGSSPGWWAATVATYCPSRMVEHSKSKSTQPTDKPPAPPCTIVNCNDIVWIPALSRPTHFFISASARSASGRRWYSSPVGRRPLSTYRSLLDFPHQTVAVGESGTHFSGFSHVAFPVFIQFQII